MNNDIEYLENRPFRNLIMSIGVLPSSYVASMSYQELLYWLCNYLEETVIPTVNNNGQAVEELQGLYVELKEYVDTYFENLDVQEEINNKLDDMTESGELTEIIKDYVDPIYQAYETSINEAIANIDSKVTSIAGGSPKGVYSTVSDLTTADPDHDYIYVVTADGKWYYYDIGTSNWVAGGTYQATAIADYSITPLKTQFFDTTDNLMIPEFCLLGKQVNGSTGNIENNANYFLTNEMPITPNKNYAMFNKSKNYFGNTNLILYDSNHDFISKVTSVYSSGIITTEETAAYFRIECRVVNVDSSYDIAQWCVKQINAKGISGRFWEIPYTIKTDLYKQPIAIYDQNFARYNGVSQGGCIMDNLFIACNRFAHYFLILNLDNLNNYAYYFADETLTLNHANDITYNSLTDKIIMADMVSNKLLEWNPADFSVNREITISADPAVTISGIHYDETNDRYVGYTEDNNFIILDSSFNVVSQTPFTLTGAKQGLTVYKDNIILSSNSGNYSYLNYFGFDGTLIKTQQLPIPDGETAFEIEGVACYNNMFIINGLSNNKTYYYLIENEATTIFNSIISLVNFLTK